MIDTSLPQSAKYLIIGAGVHGLSTGWHLAQELKKRGKGDGSDILIIDKKGVIRYARRATTFGDRPSPAEIAEELRKL